MCGIAGILKIHDPKDGEPPHPLEAIPEKWLDILDESIKHRGPDGQGRFRDRAVREDGLVVRPPTPEHHRPRGRPPAVGA